MILSIVFDVVLFALGAGWSYARARQKYHHGCALFMGECATLILADEFNAATVAAAFHSNMPWQKELPAEWRNL